MSSPAPNTLNYMVGKGKVYFDRLDTNNLPTGELDLGNDPSFVLTPENETLEHFSSMEGVKKKDKVAIISSELNGKFTLDEINIENLCLALYGEQVEYLNQNDGNVNNEAIIAHTGKWVKFTYRKIAQGSVVVTSADGLTIYGENVDYTIDYTIGRIFIIIAGNINNNQNLLVDYTYQQASYPSVYPTTRAQVEGLLRFVGNNTFGYDYEIVLWHVKLMVNGDLNFISDDWNTIEFSFEGLDDSKNHPNNPYGMIIDIEGDTAPES